MIQKVQTKCTEDGQWKNHFSDRLWESCSLPSLAHAGFLFLSLGNASQGSTDVAFPIQKLPPSQLPNGALNQNEFFYSEPWCITETQDRIASQIQTTYNTSLKVSKSNNLSKHCDKIREAWCIFKSRLKSKILSDDHGSVKAGGGRAKWDTKRVVAYTKSKCTVAPCTHC